MNILHSSIACVKLKRLARNTVDCARNYQMNPTPNHVHQLVLSNTQIRILAGLGLVCGQIKAPHITTIYMQYV